MSGGMKGLIIGAVIVLVVAIAVMWAPVDEKPPVPKSEPEPIAMTALGNIGFNTHYVPLPDINGDDVIEKQLAEHEIEYNGALFEKTAGYQDVVRWQVFSVLLTDEAGNYITVGDGGEAGGYTDIRIIKYNQDGNEIIKKTYGGSDFDTVYAAKYNPKMGIVITGISQSADGDFSALTEPGGAAAFVACIDAETLAVRWVSPVQIAGDVFCVTDDGVFVVRNEGAPYDGDGSLNLSVVKLDRDGKKVWQTEPLDQWIHSIAALRDGRAVIVQELIKADGTGHFGVISCYSEDGTRLSAFEPDCYGAVTPTDDGGFITVSVRNVKTIPQPVYISSIWFDTETVATKYDSDFQVMWRKTYDHIKDAIGVDVVIPQGDGSVIVVL